MKDALGWLVEDVQRRLALEVELTTDQTPLPLDDVTSALLFRAVRELLTNVVKHAKSSQARVVLQQERGCVGIRIEDDGVGFDVTKLGSGGAMEGFGLFSIREQLGRRGGKIDIDSAPGRGTRVSLVLPLDSAAGDGKTPSREGNG